MEVEPFEVDVPQADLDALRQRLVDARWPPDFPAADPASGIGHGYLRELVHAWAHDYDWRAEERRLNALPHARAVVDGHRIHFVEVQGVGPDPMPLVMTHGWPSTFAEFTHVIGPLTDPAAYGGDPEDAFTVVLPSLPGYGFSDPSPRAVVSPTRVADLWSQLMPALGYERFGAAGCDWGAFVSTAMAARTPGPLVGLHLGMVAVTGARRADEEALDESDWLDRTAAFATLEQAYVALQGTKPESLALGLSDSPVGLAGWVAEKWTSWSDHAGDPAEAISPDDLLTALSIYWFTNTIGSSLRIYEGQRREPLRLPPGRRIEVPTGFLLECSGGGRPGPQTLLTTRPGAPSRIRAERAYDVQRWTAPERGGHFPALEVPDLYVHELQETFRPLR